MELKIYVQEYNKDKKIFTGMIEADTEKYVFFYDLNMEDFIYHKYDGQVQYVPLIYLTQGDENKYLDGYMYAFDPSVFRAIQAEIREFKNRLREKEKTWAKIINLDE